MRTKYYVMGAYDKYCCEELDDFYKTGIIDCTMKEGYTINIRIDKKLLDSANLGLDGEDISAKIIYCPWCGKKLIE